MGWGITCRWGLHRWKFYDEKHKAMGLPHTDEITLYIRECKYCGKRQASGQHPETNMFSGWGDTDIKPGSILKYIERR
jgi:hypothetical protein